MSNIGKLVAQYNGDYSLGGVFRGFIVSEKHFIIEHTREIYNDLYNFDVNYINYNNNFEAKYPSDVLKNLWNLNRNEVMTLVWDMGEFLDKNNPFWKIGNIFVQDGGYYVIGTRTNELEKADVIELTIKNNTDKVNIFYYQNLNGEIYGEPYNLTNSDNNRLYQTGIYDIPPNGLIKTLMVNTIKNFVPDQIKNNFNYRYPLIFTFSKETPGLTLEIKYLNKKDLRRYSMY